MRTIRQENTLRMEMMEVLMAENDVSSIDKYYQWIALKNKWSLMIHDLNLK